MRTLTFPPPSAHPLLVVMCLQLAVRCKVEVLSFSAHADYGQTSGFLDALQPPHVVLVHGERGEMMKLRGVSQTGWASATVFTYAAPSHAQQLAGCAGM